MNLENYYWYFKEAIPPRICDDIVKYGNAQKEDIGLTGGGYSRNPDDMSPNQKKELEKKRKSNIVWMSHPWIYRELQPLLQEANKNAGWNFQWDWSEPCQFTKYKLNQYYEWHMDSGEKPYDNPNNFNSHGKIRKLSMTVSLVDGSEYEGGDFQLDFRNKEENDPHIIKHVRLKGSVVVFPSFVWHRVTPVTSGQRYSLVCWTLGWPYK